MKHKIKRLFVVWTISFAGILSGCQHNTGHDADLEAYIISLDKAGWEAWKHKDGNWFAENTTKDFVSISADGISNREQVIKSTASDCDVKGYALSNIKFTELTATSVLLTYTVVQEGTCGGTTLHPNIRVAANYIKQQEQWLEAFYMESKMD